MRILLVDDDPNLLEAFAHVLGIEHDVVIAKGGQDALDALEWDTEYDMVLLDVVMPEVNGWQVYLTIRQCYPELASRVVFCSGRIRRRDVARHVEHSGNVVLTKPFDPAQLLQVLHLLAGPTS